MDISIYERKACSAAAPADGAVDVVGRLRAAGLRPTQQRRALAGLLFAHGDRHVSAEQLHDEAIASGVRVSLATVYNTLNQFTEAGLLRELAVDSAKAYFDTNTNVHHHYFVEGRNEVLDIPGDVLNVDDLPAVPDDLEIARVDVVVRLCPKR